MAELTIHATCPQTNKGCLGTNHCKLDRTKGCIAEILELWKRQVEDEIRILDRLENEIRIKFGLPKKKEVDKSCQ